MKDAHTNANKPAYKYLLIRKMAKNTRARLIVSTRSSPTKYRPRFPFPAFVPVFGIFSSKANRRQSNRVSEPPREMWRTCSFSLDSLENDFCIRDAFGRAILDLYLSIRIQRMSGLELCPWTCLKGSLKTVKCRVERHELFFREEMENWWRLYAHLLSGLSGAR